MGGEIKDFQTKFLSISHMLSILPMTPQAWDFKDGTATSDNSKTEASSSTMSTPGVKSQ